MIQYKTCYQRKGKTEYVTKWNTYYVWFSRIRCLFFVFVFGGGGGEDRARQTGPNRLEKPNQTDRTELIEWNLFFFLPFVLCSSAFNVIYPSNVLSPTLQRRPTFHSGIPNYFVNCPGWWQPAESAPETGNLNVSYPGSLNIYYYVFWFWVGCLLACLFLLIILKFVILFQGNLWPALQIHVSVYIVWVLIPYVERLLLSHYILVHAFANYVLRVSMCMSLCLIF